MEHAQPNPSPERPWRRTFPWRTAEEAIEYRQGISDSLRLPPWERAAAEQFDLELEELPAQDIELAREVFTGLATSPLDDIRDAIALRIDLLYFADKEFGLPLWLALLDDPNWEVALTAYGTFDGLLEIGELSDDEVLPMLITYQKATERYYAYRKLRRQSEADDDE